MCEPPLELQTRLQSCTIAVSSIPCLAHPRVQTKGWVCANMCQYTPRISWRCRISSKDIHPWPFMVERRGKWLCGARQGQNQGLKQNLSLNLSKLWPFDSWPGDLVYHKRCLFLLLWTSLLLFTSIRKSQFAQIHANGPDWWSQIGFLCQSGRFHYRLQKSLLWCLARLQRDM